MTPPQADEVEANRGRFAVIAGGGTAGHVHPGLAVADALVQRGHAPEDILYVGSERGIEHELVPKAGFELQTLPGKGIPRQISVQALRAGASLGWGAVKALRLLRQERPRVVLSLGGFAAVPCALAARTLGIPVVIHEQNAVPGSANRLIAKWAKASAISFPNTALANPVLTGNPVRPEMLAVDPATDGIPIRSRLGLGLDQRLVVVTGGSLGALRLNNAALDAAPGLTGDGRTVLYHVVGKRDWVDLAGRIAALDSVAGYHPVEYEHEMPAVFAAADLVVSRAGASTTAELAVLGLPSVLVPLPNAPGDHQRANASALVDAGGATMVEDSALDGSRLLTEAQAILNEPGRLEAMAHAAAGVGRRDAADHVAAMLEEHAK